MSRYIGYGTLFTSYNIRKTLHKRIVIMLLWKPSLRLYSAIWCDCIRYTLDDTRTHARITKYVFAQHLLTLARRQNGSIFASTTLNSRGWPLQMIWIDFSMKKKNKSWSCHSKKHFNNFRTQLPTISWAPSRNDAVLPVTDKLSTFGLCACTTWLYTLRNVVCGIQFAWLYGDILAEAVCVYAIILLSSKRHGRENIYMAM